MTPDEQRILDVIRQDDLLSSRQLASRLDVPDERFDAFVKQLFDLQARGLILRLPERGWSLPEKSGCRVGEISITRGGNGFVVPVGDEEGPDYFIPARATGGAFAGDLVIVQTEERPGGRSRGRRGSPGDSGQSPRARVLDVVRRRQRPVMGRFQVGERARGPEAAGFVEPLESNAFSEIFIDGPDRNGASPGQKVYVKLLDGWGPGGALARGRIEHVVEDEGSYESDLKAIATEFGLPLDMDPGAEAEAARLPSPDDPANQEGREDLRGLRIFTIDPDDARDFDDAISLESLGDGKVRLGVHIADVSTYVRPGTRLDEVAFERGTSVYLPGRVLPMLPEKISNGLASLRPGEPRLTQSVFLDFDAGGRRLATRICRGVIQSERRFTYDEVLAVLRELDPRAAPADQELPLPEDADDYREVLAEMARLRDALYARRLERGCLELEIPAVRLQLDSSGEMQKITREGRDPSHHLIEEFMLAANEAVATFLIEHQLPIIARVHRKPEEESFEEFLDFLSKIDPRFEDAKKRGLKDLQAILVEVADEPYAGIVNLQFLRSLQHAEYAPAAGLHFALATETYCHFTSPIRRYPDLVVHRVLESYLLHGNAGKPPGGGSWPGALEVIAKQSSELERVAEKAERELTRTRLIRHLEDRVGEEMDASIVSVSPHGMFVQVDEILFDGFVHVSSLGNDYFEFDRAHLSLTGTRSQRVFRIGDRVRVELVEVNADVRDVNFVVVKKLPAAR